MFVLFCFVLFYLVFGFFFVCVCSLGFFCERAGGEGILEGSFSFHVLKLRILAEELRFIKESGNELMRHTTHPPKKYVFHVIELSYLFLML